MQNFALTKTVKKAKRIQSLRVLWGQTLGRKTCVRSRIGLVQEQVDTEYADLSWKRRALAGGCRMCFQSECLGQKSELLLTWTCACIRAQFLFPGTGPSSRAFYSWVSMSAVT